MRVLITNLQLWPRTGTVLYVRDLALGLIRRGLTPAVHSLAIGPIRDELDAAGVRVVSDPRDVPWTPDVIHGHHAALVRLAIRAHPGVPVLTVCHDHTSPHDGALRHPAVRRHFAVSALCVRRRLGEGVPADAVEWLPNFVDLERFRPRAPLPVRPRRALVFSNYASEATHLPPIRAACERLGLQLDVVGLGVGRPADAPEALLPQYDVVFAKARAALEAMAVGTAVVLCDFGGVGPLVRSTSFLELQRLNFGFEALTGPLTADAVSRQLARYDAVDAARVRDMVGRHASLDLALDRLQAAYAACVAEGATPHGTWRDRLAATRADLAIRAYWRWLSWPAARRRRFQALGFDTLARAGLLGVVRPRPVRDRAGSATGRSA